MVGWHDQLNGREFEQVLGDGDGQGSLESQSHKESDMTEQQMAHEKNTNSPKLSNSTASWKNTIHGV